VSPALDKPRVVFLCIGNACRSPMGEGLLRHMAGDLVDVASGGVHPIGVQPSTVDVMDEIGVDIRAQDSTWIHAHLDPPPAVLIALSESALARAPRLPRETVVLRWPVPDPYMIAGDAAAQLRAYRGARDEIKERLEEWLASGAAPLGLPPRRTPKR